MDRDQSDRLRVCVIDVQHPAPGTSARYELAERSWSSLLSKLGELLDRFTEPDGGLPDAAPSTPPTVIRIAVRQ